MTFLSNIKRLFRRRPVVVQTYKVQKSDWIKRHFELHRQLAEELGRAWPPEALSETRAELERERVA